MNDNVISIKSRSTPADAPPDALILNADTSFMVQTSLRSWKAGVVISDPADIALLASIPAKRYRLITQKDDET